MRESREEEVRKAFEKERMRRDESQRQTRQRLKRYSSSLYWLGLAAYLLISGLAIFAGTSTGLLLLADLRDGLLPAKMVIPLFVFMCPLPVIVFFVLLRTIWRERPEPE